MADIVRGAEVTYNIKPAAGVEAAAGATGWQSVHAYGDTFQPGEGLVDDDELGGAQHNAIDPKLPAEALPAASGGLTVPQDLSQLPFWFAGMFGPPVTTGTTPNYTHTFTSGLAVPVLRHVEILMATGLAKIVDAMAVAGVTLDLADMDGFRKTDIEAIMRSVRGPVAAIATTPSAPPVRAKVSGSNGVMKIDDVLLGNVLGGKLNLRTGAFGERYLDDTGYFSAVEVGRPSLEISPQLRLRKDSATILNKFDGKTPFKIELLHQLNANLSLSIVATQCVAAKVLPNTGGVGPMDVTPVIRAGQKVTSTTAPMVTITIKNQVASYV